MSSPEPPEAIDFDGRVALVTGAGRGIGRATALALARRGARILVNDYGGEGDTLTPGGRDVAEAVVAEVRAAGGTAQASATQVGSGDSADAIVAQALEAFGRVDILINNAGGSLGIVKVDADGDAEVEGVIRSNLLGPYMLIRRLWPIMRRERYGRIVNVMSGAMFGMAGTAAYSTAKSGLLGLTNTIAIEGAGSGILANGVCPVAFTRLAGKLDDEATFRWMQRFPPELVAEGIIYLSSEACAVTGQTFTVGGGRFARNAIFGAPGIQDDRLTAERIAGGIATACRMEDATLLASTQDENRRLG